MKKLLSIFFPLIAINEVGATADLVAIGTATNVVPIEDGEEWNMITPYGEFPNPLGLQIMDRTAADEIVAAFNSVFAKLGRLFRGLPVYRGHPDVMPERWPDDKRYGRYEKLEARDDGLYGKPAWNAAGRENVQEGYYVYPSPAWHFRDLGQGRIRPTNLVSVGLTNTPNISAAVPVTNAVPAPKPTTTNQPENQDTMPKWLIEKLIACNVLAKLPEGQEYTEEQLQTALNTLGDKLTSAINLRTAAEGIVTVVNSQKSTLETDLKKFRDRTRDLLTAAAVNEGRLTGAEVPASNAKFDADFAAAETELAAKKKAINTEPLNLKRTAAGDLSTPEGRRLAYNARVDELTAPIAAGGKGLNYQQAVNHLQSSQEDAALMKALNDAGSATHS